LCWMLDRIVMGAKNLARDSFWFEMRRQVCLHAGTCKCLNQHCMCCVCVCAQQSFYLQYSIPGVQVETNVPFYFI
jgi:hypothetical protein